MVPGVADSITIPLHKHHLNLVKFSSTRDQAFDIVADQIDIMMKFTMQKIGHNWEHEIALKSKLLSLDSGHKFIYLMYHVQIFRTRIMGTMF